MNVLVLGATGMLGSAMFRVLSNNADWNVYGTIRSADAKRFFAPEMAGRLVSVGNLENHDQLTKLFDEIRPHVVVNCVALEKSMSADPLRAISIFSMLPQRLSRLCMLGNARLVQISSDGVFSGSKGGYIEDDFADAVDIYGIAKILGEVREPHAITIRTSIIGHELRTKNGLLEWFLAQTGQCKGFTRAIFSGLPTVVLAQVIRDVVIPRPDLHGVYHVAAEPISKFDLLSLLSKQYKKTIEIVPDDKAFVDRSLVADRFRKETQYVPPGWPELVKIMYSHRFDLARA